MKFYTNLITLKKFYNNFLNIGERKKEREEGNINLLFATPTGIDQVNLEKSLKELKKSLYLITNTIAKGGKILVYLSQDLRDSTEKKFFINRWPKGLISNFKNVGRNLIGLPNLILVLRQENKERNSIEREIKENYIAAVFLNNSNNKQLGLFSIPGSSTSKSAETFITEIIKIAISLGFLKEIAKTYRQKLPRLGSNQRPGT